LARIEPFRALRYTDAAGPLAELVAPPYDVIGEAERDRLAASRPANAIHVILPQGERPYDTAAALLSRWESEGAIAIDREPAMFLYAQRFAAPGGEAERWGLLAALQLEPLDGGVVLPHERTLAAPKADRLNLIRACRTNLSPIFGMVDAPLDLPSLAASAEAIAEFTDRAGVRHRLWKIADAATIERLRDRFAKEQVFIADGHHRYETALAYRDECRAAASAAPGTRAHDFILFYLTSTRDPGLVVLPTHRLLAAAASEEEILAPLRDQLAIERVGDPAALANVVGAAPSVPGRPRVGIARRGGGSFVLEVTPGSGAERKLASLPEALRSLDVSLLHHVVLPGIAADRFTYTHDDGEALRALESGAAELVCIVPPPRVGDVLAISRAGLTMPQKSTYFHPKVLTGLAFHRLDGSEKI
jgi:uncharacterized protein (DUF1015 family)